MPVTKSKFTAADAKLLSFEERLAIDLGEISDEDAQALVLSKVTGKVPPAVAAKNQQAMVSAALDETFLRNENARLPQVAPSSALGVTPAPDPRGTRLDLQVVESGIKGTLGESWGRETRALGDATGASLLGATSEAVRGVRQIGSALGVAPDPRFDAGLDELDEVAARGRARAESLRKQNQDYLKTIDSAAGRFGADTFAKTSQGILQVAPLLSKGLAAIPITVAALQAWDESGQLGMSPGERFAYTASQTSIEAATELWQGKYGKLGKAGRVIAKAATEGATEIAAYVGQNAAAKAQAVLTSPELNATLPKNAKEYLYNAGQSGVLGSTLAAPISTVQEVMTAFGERAQRKAGKVASERADAAVFAPVALTGTDAAFDAGIAASNSIMAKNAQIADITSDEVSLRSQLQEPSVTVDSSNIDQAIRQAVPKEQLELALPERLEVNPLSSPAEEAATAAGNAGEARAAFANWRAAALTEGPVTPEMETAAAAVFGREYGVTPEAVVATETFGEQTDLFPPEPVRGLTPREQNLRPTTSTYQPPLPPTPPPPLQIVPEKQTLRPTETTYRPTTQEDLTQDDPLYPIGTKQPDLFEGQDAQGELFNTPPPAPLAAAEQVEPSLPTDPTLAPLPVRGRDFGVASTPLPDEVSPTLPDQVTEAPTGVVAGKKFTVRVGDRDVSFSSPKTGEAIAAISEAVAGAKAAVKVPGAKRVKRTPEQKKEAARQKSIAKLKKNAAKVGLLSEGFIFDDHGGVDAALTEETWAQDEFSSDITNDTSEFGDVARRGVASGKIKILTPEEAEALRPGATAAGWYDGETIHLVPQRLPKSWSPTAVVAHELTHAGLQQIKGEKYPQYVTRIRQLAKEGNVPAQKALEFAEAQLKQSLSRGVPAAAVSQRTNNEIVAYAVEGTVSARKGGRPTGRLGAVAQDILSTVKAKLHELGYLDTSWLDLDDIVRLSSRAAEKFLDGKAKRPAAKPAKAALATDQDTDTPDPKTFSPAMTGSTSGVKLPSDNPNRSKRSNEQVGKTPKQGTFNELLLGFKEGNLQPLFERVKGLKVDGIRRVSLGVEQLTRFGVTPAMIKGLHRGTDLERSAALKAIRALKHGAKAYPIASMLKDDMRQMSFDIAVNAVGAKFLPNGDIDFDSLSKSDADFINDMLENIETYSARTYELFISKKSRKAWQKATIGDYDAGVQSEGSNRVTTAINQIVEHELLLPNDPDWPATHPESVRRMAVNWGIEIKGQTTEQLVEALNEIKNSKSMVDFRDRADQIVRELLGVAEVANSAILNYYRGKTIDRSNLKARTNVPDYMKELWGEVQDPLYNLVDTYAKLVDLSVSQQLMYQMAAEGRKLGIVADAEGNSKTNLSVPLKGKQYGPLDGTVTTPHFAAMIDAQITLASPAVATVMQALRQKAFKEAGLSVLGAGGTIVTSGVRMIKGAIILFNAITYGFNALGAPLFLSMSGNVNPKHWGQGLDLARKVVVAYREGNLTDPLLSEMFKGMILDGVVIGEVRSSELEMLSQRARESLLGAEKLIPKSVRKVKGVKDETMRAVRDFYSVMDLWSKFANYAKEKDYLRRLYKEQGKTITEDELQLLAADRTNLTNPSYGRAHAVIRTADVWGMPPFVTFMAEIPRTMGNSFAMGMRDLTNGISEKSAVKTREGALRIAGTTFAAVGFPKAAGAGAAITHGLLSNLFTEDDEEEETNGEIITRAFRDMFTLWGQDSTEEDVTIRKGLGPYTEGADMLRLKDDEAGNPMFVSTSRISPHDQYVTSVMAALREEGGADKKIAKFEALQRVAAENFFKKFLLVGLLSGKPPTLKRDAPEQYKWMLAQTTNLSGGLLGKDTLDRGLNLLEKAKLVINPLKAHAKAQEQNPNDPAMTLEVWDKLFGGAIIKFDKVATTSQYIPWTLDEFSRKSDDYLKAAAAEGVNETVIARNVSKAYAAQLEGFNRSRNMVNAAIAAGMTKADILKNLKSGGVSETDGNALLSNKFKPKDLAKSKTFLQEKQTTDVNKKDSEQKRKATVKRLTDEMNKQARTK